MPVEDAAPLTRQAVLGGLPARRASMLLFAIESRTARLMVRAHREMAPALVERTVAAREHVFLQVLAEGRDLPVRPRIQDLERYASQWAGLVAPEPSLRAALAHLLGRKYTFSHRHVPAVRRALGLDDAAVNAAHQRMYGQPVRAIFASAVGWREEVRWLWARLAQRLDALPPFWTAFALTLTETIGAGTLAVPIAMASIGPLAGLALLALVGLINVVTVAALAEAFARNGAVRYGGAFFGRLIAEYLAGAGSAVLTVALLAFSLASLLVYYVGVATTLAGVAGVPAGLWAALLFAAGVAALRRDALDATVAAALVVGAVNISLILAMAVLALPHVSAGRLVAVNLPLAAQGGPDVATLGPVLGVSLAAYFGHTSIANCAQVVLRRDASGRALITGAVAATLVALGV
ncbi:MAG: hypothetical protein M3336_07745, partial [Chloroflexota bacterium]|nr:hypothetical protein [Chloroflexota bacterium]